MFKKIFCISLILIITTLTVVLPTAAYVPSSFEVDAEGALLVNMDTGDRIFEKNVDKKLYPASLTKLMTALVLYESVSDLDNTIITVSEYAIRSLDGTDSSTGGLKIGEKLSARQMLYVLLLSSANEGANAIAETVGGNIEGFVAKMNEKAKALGMNGTHYANAHGLHDEQHYTTVNDMYILTTAVLNVPVLKDVCYTSKYTLEATNMSDKRSYTTTNFLKLNNGMTCTAAKYKGQPYYYKYADGVKTGYTDDAGRCLVSTASKDGENYMCILMKSPVYDSNGSKIRIEFGDSKALYEWAFNDFERKQVLSSGKIVGEVPIELSWDTDYVSAATEKNLMAVVPKGADESTISYDIRWYQPSFTAPLTKGDYIGECDVVYAGKVLGTVKLVASQDVERNTLLYVANSVRNFFKTVFGSTAFLIVLGLIGAAIIIFIIILIILNSPKRRRRRY